MAHPNYHINGVHIRLPESTTVYSCKSSDADKLLEFLGDFLEQRNFEVLFDHNYENDKHDS